MPLTSQAGAVLEMRRCAGSLLLSAGGGCLCGSVFSPHSAVSPSQSDISQQAEGCTHHLPDPRPHSSEKWSTSQTGQNLNPIESRNGVGGVGMGVGDGGQEETRTDMALLPHPRSCLLPEPSVHPHVTSRLSSNLRFQVQ